MERSAFRKAWLNEIEPHVDGDFEEFRRMLPPMVGGLAPAKAEPIS